LKAWLRFILKNKRLMNFGFLFNFFSSFGQSFFISLFVPFWIKAFDITNAAFGSMFAGATIISAFMLTLTGRYIDRLPLRHYGMMVFVGLVISVAFLSQSYNVTMLMIGLLLVRLFGQGLMTHTSSTGIARHFDQHRGKALAFTTLGHPVGQLIIPLAVAALMAQMGWRLSLLIMAAVSLVVVLPSVWAITPVTRFRSVEHLEAPAKNDSAYFKSLTFWIITLNIFVVPFIGTAVFLYQYSIGQSRGWDMAWVAFSFAFYAVFNAISLLVSGNLVDRFTGLKLFPLYLIPTLAALLLMALSIQPWIFPLFYALLGISSGLGSTIKPSVQVEIYGKANLGKIRSYFSTLLVLSTALGPPAFGYFLDRAYPLSLVMLLFAAATAVIIVLSFRVRK
jgi:MFS family permease